MTRFIFCMPLMLLWLGCSDKANERAEELYELANYYGQSRDYDRAINILQRIRIDFEKSKVAELAEEEIGKYEELKNILITNEYSKLKAAFEGIGRALENYRTRYQAYPLTAKDLEKITVTMIPNWEDPWGNTIYYKPIYSSPEIPRHLPDKYVLASFGEDGLPGGLDQSKDHFYQDSNIVERIFMD